jgi:hypothetical protein
VRITGYFSAAVAAVLVAGCGGGGSDTSASPAPAAATQSTTVYGSPGYEAQQLIAFGQTYYAQLFPNDLYNNGNQYSPPFVYRYYSTGNYLGVVVDGGSAYPLYGVYVMGKSFGQQPQYVGQLTSFVQPAISAQDTSVSMGAVLDSYVGTWTYCDNPTMAREGFTVILTKINDTQLSASRSRYLYPTVDCSGPPSQTLSSNNMSTLTFGNTVMNAGWAMNQYVATGVFQGYPFTDKSAMVIAGGGLYFDAYENRDANGYPTKPGDGPYIRQTPAVGWSPPNTSGVTFPEPQPSISVGP